MPRQRRCCARPSLALVGASSADSAHARRDGRVAWPSSRLSRPTQSSPRCAAAPPNRVRRRPRDSKMWLPPQRNSYVSSGSGAASAGGGGRRKLCLAPGKLDAGVRGAPARPTPRFARSHSRFRPLSRRRADAGSRTLIEAAASGAVLDGARARQVACAERRLPTTAGR
jgi:hypothetical protein